VVGLADRLAVATVCVPHRYPACLLNAKAKLRSVFTELGIARSTVDARILVGVRDDDR
jgi:hypothetical protein